MRIKLGEAISLNRPEDIKFTPDDRTERIETVGGNHIEDGGIIASGETISFTAIFSPQNWAAVRLYWENRQKVAFTDDHGVVHFNRRVKVKSWSYKDKFDYYEVEIELWNV